MRDINKKTSERGAVIVEFAILLPFLLSILVGTIEFGLLFYNKQVLTNASREGARAGIAYATNISDIVDNYAQNRLINLGPVTPIKTEVSGGGSYPSDLQVSVTYVYTFLLPELVGFGTSMTLSASTEMKMEILDLTGT